MQSLKLKDIVFLQWIKPPFVYDISGKPFDGTHYLFPLEETIVYKAMVSGDFSVYNEYMKSSNQYHAHTEENFKELIKNFDITKFDGFEIRYLPKFDKYALNDGTHRLCIMIKRGIITDEIPEKYIIKSEKQLKIESELEKTTNYTLRGGWHTNTKYGYHSFNIEDVNIIAQRNPAIRINEFRKYFDFKDKTVFDLGCSVGGMLFHLPEIKFGIGLDYDQKAINCANNIANILNKINLVFDKIDFETNDLKDIFTNLKPDVIFLLSLGSWIKNWYNLYEQCLEYRCPIILETNNENEGFAQLEFFKNNGLKIKTIIEKSLDDSTGNDKRKTYLIAK